MLLFFIRKSIKLTFFTKHIIVNIVLHFCCLHLLLLSLIPYSHFLFNNFHIFT